MFAPHQLISPQYRDLQRVLHAAPKAYGERGDKWAGIVLQLAMQYRVSSILDYGCGEGSLAKMLKASPLRGIRVDEYDPAIAGKDVLPSFADLVVCTDVLEHIEPDRLDSVLAHIRMLARKVVWMVVSTQESANLLEDGRNAHLTIRPGKWWKKHVRKLGFTLQPVPTVVRYVPKKEWRAVLTP